MQLNNENFMIYCARHYDNPNCMTTEEFTEDMMRLKYIKKLITRYVDNGELKERLILNHLIVLSNVFKPEILCKIIWLKMPDTLQYIKPFLVLLGILPDVLKNGDEIIDTTLVPMDQYIVNELRHI